MSRGMKILAGVGIVIVAGAIVIPRLISTDAIVAEVTQEVEAMTGRTLTIQGGASLSIFPSLNIALNDVQFANFPEGTGKNMVSMKSLTLHLPWMSIFSGKIELDRFVIQEPTILLETSKTGKPNWQLFAATNSEPAAAGQSATTLPEGLDIALGEVAIYGGSVTYLDGVTGAKEQLQNVNVTVLLPSLFKNMQINGEVTYKNEVVRLETSLETPAKLIEGQPYAVKTSVNAAPLSLDFEGQIAQGGKQVDGALEVKGDSLAKLTQWHGVTLAQSADAYNAFAVKGKMALNQNVFKLTDFSASLDALKITGASTVTLADVPAIRAKFDLGMLDVNPYLPPELQDTKQEESSPATKPEPIVWDDSKIDLSALKGLDIELNVTATGLKARKITLGENQFSLVAKNGVAKLSLDKFNAYEGNGIGQVTINAAKTPYQISSDFSLDKINAQPLLNDAVGFDKVLGKGSIAFALATHGESQKQFVNALNGNFNFALTDGGVKGANLAEMVRQAKELLKGDLSSLKNGLNSDFDKDKTTDFSSLTGSFLFKQGVGTNRDLMMASPLLRITGEGQVDLPNTLVDYRLVTGIVDTIEGQNSQDKSTGFKVPVRIKGPFHDVKTNLDLSDAAKEQAKDKVKDKLKDKLKGLFGG